MVNGCEWSAGGRPLTIVIISPIFILMRSDFPLRRLQSSSIVSTDNSSRSSGILVVILNLLSLPATAAAVVGARIVAVAVPDNDVYARNDNDNDDDRPQ